MRTNIDTAPYKKDFLNYADNDGFIREGIVKTLNRFVFY